MIKVFFCIHILEKMLLILGKHFIGLCSLATRVQILDLDKKDNFHPQI